MPVSSFRFELNSALSKVSNQRCTTFPLDLKTLYCVNINNIRFGVLDLLDSNQGFVPYPEEGVLKVPENVEGIESLF